MSHPSVLLQNRLAWVVGAMLRKFAQVHQPVGPNSLNSSFLRRTAAVMWQRSHVLNHHYFDATVGQGTNCTFPSRARALDKHVHFFQPGFRSRLSRIRGGHLGGIGGVFLGSLKAHLSGTTPGDDLTLLVGDADNDVIEAGRDVGVAVVIHSNNALFRTYFCSWSLCFCHNSLNEVIVVFN